MTISLSRKATADLAELHRYVSRDSRSRADATVDRILNVLDMLAGGVEGPEVRLTRGQVIRSWPVPPYRIYYRRLKDRLQVVRIYHQARRPIERES